MTQYLNRKPLAQKPTAHISYDEGIHLIRQFLLYASHHTVEDIQRFTSQWVPHPTWVKVDEVKIGEEHIQKSAAAIQEQLGDHGIEKVGGKNWWQWRRPGSELKAEWIEMRSDYQERKKNKDPGKRVMLYVHGGAYFFGSVDEHRYQMQRHARKLKARVFAPRYRLSPQFPFPCGLHDCLAAYLYLLTVQDPTTIILAGDSAGGGMVVSMLVTMRDRGIPLPAGAILISPWVDLTHSFPSVAGDNPLDYIPPHGFHQRPSKSWPPPNSDDMLAIQEGIVKKLASKDHARPEIEADAVQGFHVDHHPTEVGNDTAATGTVTSDGNGPEANTIPGPGHNLSIMVEGSLIEIKDQIQMYATNHLISHPLVSPVLQPSLGGLPPLLILVGGGEMLRDEQIYLAHKAANPTKYPPGDAFLDESPHDHNRNQVDRWKPTDVQLQVWDDLCHVAPTLSFTRPAKHMYRSIAQFGAWTLARAQHADIDIMDDDDVSVISSSSSNSSDEDGAATEKKLGEEAAGTIGKAGDPLPAFKNHMIRQRVDRHGKIFHLEPASELPGCCMSPSEIGVIKPGPVKKWMAAKKEWDTKYASIKRRVQKKRAKEMAEGYQTFDDGDVPPPSALAGRRKTGENMKEESKKRSYGMSLWALWGSSHDEKTMGREEELNKDPERSIATPKDGQGARALDDMETDRGQMLEAGKRPGASRRRSRQKTVTDLHQTEGNNEQGTSQNNDSTTESTSGIEPGSNTESIPRILVHQSAPDEEYDLKRPKAGGIAFPFTLKQEAASASMTTLTSTAEVPPTKDIRTSGVMDSGVRPNTADLKAINSPEAKKAEELLQNGSDDEKAFEAGELVSAERPPLEKFQTASEDLPTSE
ncbi:alpha hydrolase-19 [Coleophoma cylindrospora]|uniref:Alpha hydrolase-19 n=1 Tax=Coleophoma cylindrospora TaxID=1849047 RepID=A0A3D8RM85_9HELO|nr:alpha hydrolase-19 [Coleophoma cylindrospora]